jgi:hypothetical protein
MISEGKIADLSKNFEGKINDVIRSSFLKDLISGNIKEARITNFGIQISHGSFIDPLFLNNIEINYELDLRDCEFNDEVYFNNTTFNKIIFSTDCIFKKMISLEGAISNNSLIFNGSTFYSTFDLTALTVKNALQLNKINCLDNSSGLSLTGATISKILSLKHSFIDCKISFFDVNIGIDALLDSTIFNSNVSFGGAKIGARLSINNSRFAKNAYFAKLEVGATLSANNVEFHGKTVFNSFTCNGDCFFNKTVFSWPKI